MTEGTEWQARAKAVGLSQRTLASLVGLTENGVSQGIRGKWPSGIPQSLKFAVIAWEVMTPDQRAEVVRMLDAE